MTIKVFFHDQERMTSVEYGRRLFEECNGKKGGSVDKYDNRGNEGSESIPLKFSLQLAAIVESERVFAKWFQHLSRICSL